MCGTIGFGLDVSESWSRHPLFSCARCRPTPPNPTSHVACLSLFDVVSTPPTLYLLVSPHTGVAISRCITGSDSAHSLTTCQIR